MKYIKFDNKIFEIKKPSTPFCYCPNCSAYTKKGNCLVEEVYIKQTEISKCKFFENSTKLIEITSAKEKIKLLASGEVKTINFIDFKYRKEQKENKKYLNIKFGVKNEIH